MKTSILAAVAMFATIACGSASTSESPAGTTQSASTADPSRIHGTWVFVLESSDVASAIREECKKDSAGDSAKAESCYARIKTQAGKEKIRFAKDASGKMVWRSFGQDEGREELFLEVPVELAADGSSHVLAKVAGAAKGFQAEKFQRADVKAVRVEIVDEHTIAMTDPKKGRLVYTKE